MVGAIAEIVRLFAPIFGVADLAFDGGDLGIGRSIRDDRKWPRIVGYRQYITSDDQIAGPGHGEKEMPKRTLNASKRGHLNSLLPLFLRMGMSAMVC